MKTITTRYGASVPLSIEIDDELATRAHIYVGLEDAVPVIHESALVIDGVADLSIPAGATDVPLNTYKYQINIEYSDGRLDKLPQTGCWDDLPDFEVLEALDVTEAEVS